MSNEDRDKHPNLLLLCGVHHDIIDSQPTIYSVPVLRQMKADHEERVLRALSPQDMKREPEYVDEVIHSSLLLVTYLPKVVFAAPCAFRDGQEAEVKQRLCYPDDDNQLVRFLLREGKLFTFHNLYDPQGPFADMIDRRGVDPLPAVDMWRQPEGRRRYVTLLNRALYKYADRLGIRYDPNHYRFFFPVTEPGREREVEYRPLNMSRTSRKVAWQPKRKSTGEKKKFWWHLAAGIRFQQMAEKQWCLSLRPERHLTNDGTTPLQTEQIGRRVTSKKARMWNDIYLSEVNFWRNYLSVGTPRIVLNFGDQSAVVDARFIHFDVHWPSIPGDDKPFKNVVYEEDLFTRLDLTKAIEGQTPISDEFDDEDAEEEEEYQEL